MSSEIAGTFANGGSVGVGNPCAPLVIHSGQTSAKLYLTGDIGASNTVKTQKSTNNGVTWADVTTYNSAQNGTAITVADGEHWRLAPVAGQANKAINYRFTLEN